MMSASVNPSSSSWYLLFHSAPARLRRPLVSRLDGTAFRWHFALGLLLFFFFFCLNPHGVHIPPPVVSRVFVFFIILFSPWACERPRDCDFLYHVFFNSTCISYCHCNVSATSRYVSQWIDYAVYLAHTNALSSARAVLTVS